MPVRRARLALAALAVAAAVGGCGGSSSSSSQVSPSTYVKSICTAIAPFERDVQSRSTSLNLSSIKSPSQGKQALQGFLSAVVADTDKAVAQLKAAGVPNVTNGKQISVAVVGAFTALKGALSQAATQAAALPTSSATAFKTAAEALGSTVRSSMGNIAASLTGLKSPVLQTAAASDPTCRSLISAAG